MNYLADMVDRPEDHVDALIAQWTVERPDLDLGPMATFARLGRLAALAGRSIEATFAAHGLTTADFDVLAALRRSGEPFTLMPSVLSRSLMLSPAGITSRLDRLEGAGHIARHPAPDDRRSNLVVLTAQGRSVVDAAVTDHVANESRLLADLTPRQQADLDRALRTLLAQFDRPGD